MLLRDTKGKEIGSAANYYDKDGKHVDTKATYHSDAPVAAPAVASEADRDATKVAE
jgi:hypothetical protein